MKIAFVYDVIFPYVKGGAEKRFWELAYSLSRRGHEVHLYGMKSWSGAQDFLKEGVYLHGVGKHRDLYLKSGIRNAWQVWGFTRAIGNALRKEHFDIIDCNAFPYLPFFEVNKYAEHERIPLVVTWQEVWDTYWYSYAGMLKGEIARRIERRVIKQAGRIVAYSQLVKRALVNLGRDPSDICVIHQGIDCATIQNIEPSCQTSDCIFVGRLIREKNVDVLIRAFSTVRKKFPQAQCFIVGGGPEKDRLIQLAQQLNVREGVVFKDFVEHAEVLALMKASKVLVFPSTREGFGMAVIEAMGCGLPVVTVSHSLNASTEFVQDNETGYICSLSADSLASKIESLLNDDAKRKEMGAHAYRYAQQFDWERIADATEHLYASIKPL
ncbi:MAG: glycosyltransferase family 4 protein [Candidatus Omnitrophica bacterium]|nr:glycosyltransferase family 4 protein [Candidatus Omnitrophota bacterium]